MPDPKTLAALRALVAAWSPPDARTGPVVPTGVRALDTTLGGGLPAGQLSELVCPPGAGGQLVLARLLETTRTARQRVALIDATDAFAPEALPSDTLRHLVWVRGRCLADALAAADILVRDGNYGAVLLDLRDVPVVALQRTPKTLWHRLHRAAERQPAAAVVLSRHGFVPAVRWRLVLSRDPAMGDQLSAHACDHEVERLAPKALGRSPSQTTRGGQRVPPSRVPLRQSQFGTHASARTPRVDLAGALHVETARGPLAEVLTA